MNNGSGWAKDIFLANVCNGCEKQDMDILDNFEAYLEKAEEQETEKCHYCKAIATYNCLAEIDQTYKIVGVCACHSYQGLSS
jgi:hypothetical protein